jgi:basic membrane lipoprotein Med (substrate-binding protein (PBP1-ABC) superfamily)
MSQVVLLTESGEPKAALQTALQQAAQELGWTYAARVEGDPAVIETTLQAGGTVLVIDGPTLAEQARLAAQAWPAAYFISLTSGEAESPATNMLAFSGSRFDQLGFLAGMAAGLATRVQSVTAVTDLSLAGLNYRNGFLHGVRYTCPRCQLQYIDVFDVENGGAEAAQTAALYASISSDVFFAAAGQAGEAALLAAAQRGAWVIGAQVDVYTTVFENGAVTGADRVLTSLFLDQSAAVYNALKAYATSASGAGAPLTGQQPYAAANGAIVMAPYRTQALNSLDQQEIAHALARLADGSLDTGVDPATGQER